MDLFDAIQQHAATAAAADDFSAVAAAVNQLGDVVVDSSSWTFRRIGECLGVSVQSAVADFMRDLMETAGGRFADAHSLLLLGDGIRTGLRLDTDDVQADLTALIVQQPSDSAGIQRASIIQSVKNLGRRYVPAFDPPVNADQCRESWKLGKLRARIVNATALASERILPADDAQEQAAKWAQAWAEAV